MGDHSRATSISRASRQGSTTSRNQSLIKKNIAPNDLDPSDVLIERFVAWKAIVKQLIAYFEGIADIETNTAKELTRLGGVIQVPFKSGNQFLGEGGLQDVYYGIRDNTRVIADQYANLGRTIDSSIVQHLQKLLVEIKAHIKNVQNDTGKLATNVAKERELSTRLIGELSSNISSFKNRPMNVTHHTDPYVSNLAVSHQLQKQVHEENLLQKSIIIMQQNSAHFEEGIVRALQSAWGTYTEWASRSSLAISCTDQGLAARMSSLQPDTEWIGFAGRAGHLLDPETPLRDPGHINYPSKEDPTVRAVHTGYLERKKRFTRSYRESYFVLTAAGFLHSYASNDASTPGGIVPIFSLFLPMCTLGPPSSTSAKSYKFHIESGTDGSGTTKAGGLPIPGLKALKGKGVSGHAWAFRSRSREDLMEWWNDIRMLCARYLVPSEQMERSGPVEAAVRAVGYQSEESGGEQEDEDEEEGSSVEEEEHEDGEEYEEMQVVELSSYSHPEKEAGVEISSNGYAIEKKLSPTSLAPAPDADGAYHEPEGNGDVARLPSARQQEKAPEGRPPRSFSPAPASVDELEYVPAHTGLPSAHEHETREQEPKEQVAHVRAPGDSRFREAL
ncbi:hypothetical protein DXG01_014034 [Tephrocybe rancida]|nr:hypothetical protein DXG01_014034 [Tephrocybe rancida]